MGQAYGFFDCRASKEEIEAKLPTVREFAQTPSKLELSLRQGVGNLKDNQKLIAAYEKAKSCIIFPDAMSPSDRLQETQKTRDTELKYVIEARFPSATNKQTAGELGDVLNQAYQSLLYEDGEPFRGAVVHEENGEYVFRK